MSGMITMGAKSRIGEASIVVAVLAAIPGLMMFDWIYWWAGRRWGRNAIDLFVGNHPKAAARTARLEKIIHRFGWLAIVIAYFQPVPNVLIYAAAGWTRMRLRTFLILDLIGSLLWIALCVGLGYAIGQEAVDVAKAVSRYALWVTIGLVVVVIAAPVVGHAPSAADDRPADLAEGHAAGGAADHDLVAVGQERAARARSASPRCPASGRRSCRTGEQVAGPAAWRR